MKGSGAAGKSGRAAAGSPPCRSGAVPVWEVIAVRLALLDRLIRVIVAYPDRLVRAIGHPVTWTGRMIAVLDRALNHETMSDAKRRAAGVAALLAIIGVPAIIGYVV